MKHSRFGLGRRIAVVLGALALTATGAVGAQAADGDPSPAPGNINPGTSSSLTIHKHSGAQADEPGDGTRQDNISNPAVAGVSFSIQKVAKKGSAAIDLDTPEGWDLIKDVKAADVNGSGYTLENTATGVTDANGEITKNLPHGLYLVTETDAPANVVSKAAPFLVTLPLPQTNGKWLYDVHVYPKNQLQDAPTKTVSDPTGVVLGSKVDWTITAKVPAMNKEDSLSSFVVTDTLDTRLGDPVVSIPGMTIGTDYTVDVVGQKVTITFLKPASLNVGDVKIKLTTTVKSLGNGQIKNQATQFVNNPGQDRGTDTNTPQTNWGDLQITKVATGDTSKTLAGAEFEVYASEADANAGTNPVGTITTGTDGTGHITLWVGNDSVLAKNYWVKETKAPAGYILSDAVTKVNVQAGTTASTTITLKNTQQDHPNLPLTGADGQMLAIMVGSALVLLAAGAALVVNRRRKAQH
jgi:fimbrial isopeptide formation D2 family protein/LPXTG-motif cell wall-anchored protein